MSGFSIWDEFTKQRRLSYIRSRAQAEFRFENWQISFLNYCKFWHDNTQWLRRGRHKTDLVLTRYYNEGPWRPDNCIIITRYQQLCITRRLRDNRDPTEFYKGAITYNDCKDQNPQIQFRRPELQGHPDPNELGRWFPDDPDY